MSKTYTKQQLSQITDLLGEAITIELRHRFTDGMVTPERKPLCKRFNEISDQLTILGWDTEDCDLIFDKMIYEIFPVNKYLGCCRDKWWLKA